MDEFCGSKFWDWDKTWYTHNPDFTWCFEQTVLIWIPCGFLWLLGIVDIISSHQSRSSPIKWSTLCISKLGITLSLALLDLLLLLRSLSVFPKLLGSPGETYLVDFVAPAIKIFTYVMFATLLLFSNAKGVNSSGVQSVFWLILTLTEAIRFRTLLLVANSQEPETEALIQTVPWIIGRIYFPFVLLGFILHLFSDVPSVHAGATGGKQKPCPESSSSFFSKMLFHWFTDLAWKGFRKPLEFSDLWDLNPKDKSKYIVSMFDKHYRQDRNKSIKPSKLPSMRYNFHKLQPLHPTFNHSDNSTIETSTPKQQIHFLKALLKAFGPTLFFGTLLKLIPDLLTFVAPQILKLLIDFVEADPAPEPTWKGILYALILFLSAFTATCFLAQGTHRFYLAGMRARTALVSVIYRKSLLLSNAAKRESTAGEIVNLMSVDTQRATEFAQYANNLLVGAPIQISLALYFLWGILGPSAIAGLLVILTILPLNAVISYKIRKMQTLQMKKKDERVKLMNEILSGIKVLKLYAWELCFEKQVLAIRQAELKLLKDTAYLDALTGVLWQCAPFLVAIFTFGTYVLIDEENVLDAQKVFVSLSLLNIMSTHLTFLPQNILNLVQAAVAFKRIDKYMNAQEIDTAAVSHDETEVDPIVIENGTFCWEQNKPTLKNINLRVRDGSVVAVVGVVGSGKSSLLSAILGELEKSSGRVNTKGSIAYVAQQAWIQNATLKDNILFGKPFESDRYDKVLEACALKPDLEMLPAADNTEIGEKGINLSGGQKQRVALARAVYSNADLYLFDDPLSAVDAHVGKHIFQQVLGPQGLLNQRTRVLVTHGVLYLPFMDNIWVMKGGEISESGTYKQLGAFSEFLSQHFTSDDTIELEETAASQLQTVVGEGLEGMLKDNHLTRRESELRQRLSNNSSRNLQSVQSGGMSTAANTAPGIDKLIEAEKSETTGIKASVYIDYCKAAGWKLSLATLLYYLAFQIFAVGANVWLSEWSNESQKTFASTRNFFLGVYGGLGVGQVLAIVGATLVMALGTVNAAAGLHLQMLRRILQAPMSFFDTTPVGRIVNRFAKDIDILDSVLPLLLRFWLHSIFAVLATLVIISYSTPVFIAVIIPLTIVYCLIQRFYVASSRQLKRMESVTRSPIYSHFGETISGASTIRAYRQQERFVLNSESKMDNNQVSFYCSAVANRWLAVHLESLGNLVVLFAALFAVLGRESLGPGIVGLSISYALQITLYLLFLVRFTSDVESNIVAVERLQEYGLQVPQEADWEIPSRKPQKNWPEMGQVTFQSYQTRYRPGLDFVLRNVSCTIQPGEKVGIVGRTGAGKSSLALALFRIIEPTGGSITIDGQDICRLGLHDVRGRITIIPQDPVLFSGSLRLNLDPFDSFPDETIWHTLELAHLQPFVKCLPAGLNHEIAEGGENLSVGQRQLICLARALLRKTKILVLDEATAAVDLDTDDLIQQTIRMEFKDATVITIAHRLNTVLDSTRVIVLDKGEIQEFDTPKNLLSNEESLFSKMAKDAGVLGPAME